MLLQLAPAFDSTLTFGFSRVVYAPVGPEASPFAATLAEAREELQEDVPGPFEGNFDHQEAVLVDRRGDRAHITG